MQKIRDKLRRARSVAVLTGAGVSAESGVPTFRGPGGMWNQFRAEDLATPEAFARDPNFVWEWYDWRRQKIAEVQPNPGHFALAELEKAVPRFTLITQNVDDLHERAGSRNVIHVHGSLWRLRCTGCGAETDDRRAPLPERPPHCAKCNAMLRPGVVWFGEALDPSVWRAAEDAAKSAEVFVIAGTSALVAPSSGLVHAAKDAGATVIEINLTDTPVSRYVDHALRGASGELLPQLIA